MLSTESQADKERRPEKLFIIQKKLEEELQRIEKKLRIRFDLDIVWLPDTNESLSGEVKGGIIYIYEEDEEKAIETLKHEVLDYAISQVIMPYKEVTNKLISLINEDAYKRKERLVEALNKIL